MKMNQKRLIAIVLAVALIAGFALPTFASAATLTVDNIGALWDEYEKGSGTFTISDNSRVYIISSSAPTGSLLQTAQLIQREIGAYLKMEESPELVWGSVEHATEGDIVLNLDTSSGTGADGYKLEVDSTIAMVTAADVDGLIYGANNLIKCFMVTDSKSISGFTGADTPDTKERTVHLDTARKYYSVEWICNFIRQMSWMGYNALQVHVSEDGGFRGDFWDPAYYKGEFQPENDFSWLCGSYVQSWVKDPYRTDPDAGKYLTTEELVKICEVAKEYHIEIIPSFDSPAHMDYITWKFEQNYKSNKSYSFTYNGTTYKANSTSGCINYTGRTGDSSPSWPYYTTIDITDGTMAKAFVFALYEDMADFFKEYAGSTNFNIGADEVNLTSSYGPKWSYSQFPGYVNDLNRMLNAKGYTVRMFNDFIGSTTYNKSSSDKAIYTFDRNIEICYWTSDFHPTTGKWSEPVWHVKFFWENNDGTTDNWGDGGRTLYNCIQTNTYYVLREGTSGTHRDARDPDNRNWTFYGTNEEDIYNKWYPADISEKGVYTENAADVPADQLGGAYFLIWNDYAALNTEKEVWEGALDCYDEDRYYYLFDIMASNIIKMWNSDINATVTYSNFKDVRDCIGFFPGYKGCSRDADLPAATAPVKASDVDKSALQAAIDNALTNESDYTSATWATYASAITAAKAVLANSEATQDDVDTALNNLTAAKNNLVKKADKTALQTAVNNAVTNAEAYTAESWTNYANALNAAKTVLATEDATQAQVDEALNALNNAQNALVEKTVVDKSSLQAAVNAAITDQGDYTDDSWKVYQDALSAAKTVLNDANATQEQVNTALSNLNKAKASLVVNSEDAVEIINIRKLTKTAVRGKKIGLVINTTTNAETVQVFLNGEPVELTLCLNNTQIISGEEVRVWMINFPATQVGTFEYVIAFNGTVSETVTITVK